MNKLITDPNADIKKPKLRVAISVPTGDQCAAGFAYDLARMMTFTAASRRDIEMRLHFVRDSILPRARHDLAQFALEQDCTHLLFLDSDMRFPKDTLVRLLAHREPVVGANYARRRLPILPTAMTEEGNLAFVEPGVDGLVSVGALGMGVMLVDADIFKKVPLPWFQSGYDGRTGQYVGEDVYFCALIREHGLSVLADNTLSREVTHLGEMEYRSEHALLTREQAAQHESVDGDAGVH